MNWKSSRVGKRPHRLDRVASLVTLLVLAAAIFSGAGASNVPLAFGHAHGKTFQAWTPVPPDIDGTISDFEWQTAASSSFSLTIGTVSYSGVFYVMNDATNLYIGIKIADDDFNAATPADAVAVYFDNNNSGLYESGEDGIAYIADGTGFLDRFMQSVGSMRLDTDFGGTSDGSGAVAAHGGYNHFELLHPLNSPDHAHDFSLSQLNTVGFTVLYADGPAGQGTWPAPATENASGWGDIVVASSPPSLSAWSPTAPTIDGTIEAIEWESAPHVTIAIGAGYIGELMIMNDATNLYVAAKIVDTSLTANDNFYVRFDNNNDGVVAPGDDELFVSGTSQFVDKYSIDGVLAADDTVAGGTKDGVGSASGSVGFNSFEVKHPLDSADNGHDFTLFPGSTVGFSIVYREASGYVGEWPSQNPKSWAHLTVVAPDFTISCSPASVAVVQGSSETSRCTVTSITGFNSAVGLTGSWVGTAPSGVTHILPSPITPTSGGTASSTLMISAVPTAETGEFVFRVTGTSSLLSHYADVDVQVNAGTTDFTISAAPSVFSLAPGGSASSTITVQSVGIFSSPVNLAGSGAPGGMTLAFGTNPILPPPSGIASSLLTITVSGAPTGTYAITVTGASDALTRSTSLTVEVKGVGGGCLIATATYGSELADEVQFLRNFRDKSILRTASGSSFMAVFNAWYYSFSPGAAEFIYEHPTARTATRFALYPLMGILRISAAIFYLFPANLEASAIASGIVASSLIGLVYLTFPLVALLACSNRARRIAGALRLPVAVMVMAAIVVLALTELHDSSLILMMLTTSTVVLGCLTVSALIASQAIIRILKRD